MELCQLCDHFGGEERLQPPDNEDQLSERRPPRRDLPGLLQEEAQAEVSIWSVSGNQHADRWLPSSAASEDWEGLWQNLRFRVGWAPPWEANRSLGRGYRSGRNCVFLLMLCAALLQP